MPALPILSPVAAESWLKTLPLPRDIATAIDEGELAARALLTYEDHIGRAQAVGVLRIAYLRATGRVFDRRTSVMA